MMAPKNVGPKEILVKKNMQKNCQKKILYKKNLGINNFCQQYVGQTKILVPKIFFLKKNQLKKRGVYLRERDAKIAAIFLF